MGDGISADLELTRKREIRFFSTESQDLYYQMQKQSFGSERSICYFIASSDRVSYYDIVPFNTVIALRYCTTQTCKFLFCLYIFCPCLSKNSTWGVKMEQETFISIKNSLVTFFCSTTLPTSRVITVLFSLNIVVAVKV